MKKFKIINKNLYRQENDSSLLMLQENKVFAPLPVI